MKRFGRLELISAGVVFLITAAIILYKIYGLGYSMTTIKPEDGYFIQLIMTVTGNGQDCNLRVTLPIQSDRQTIKYERESSGGDFKYTISPNRVARWQGKDLAGEYTISYTFFAQTEAQSYPLPKDKAIPTEVAEFLRPYLEPTERIQADASEIVQQAYALAPEGMDIETAMRNIYNFCYSTIAYKTVKGPTDALTALRLVEASCNGKNRLMVALLRARGIPARMANGLILQKNRKRTTHAWTLVRIGDAWVPFCPTNGYFAEIPAHYLELAKGDKAVFVHTKHIGFDWRFVIQHQLSHREQAVFTNANNPMNILSVWTSLKDYHISLELIMIILMIPIGATVVAFARNLIGVLPFGTFMPALIAVSFRDTGLVLGALFFLIVIVVCASVDVILMRMRLLHVPRLVIMITLVVMSIMALSVVCLKLGYSTGAAVSLFPMAILSLTCERFAQTVLEDGLKAAMQRMAATFFVAAACFFVYELEFLQIIIVAFPELLLANIGINLILGSWTGMRLMEYYRFRELLRSEGNESAAGGGHHGA